MKKFAVILISIFILFLIATSCKVHERCDAYSKHKTEISKDKQQS